MKHKIKVPTHLGEITLKQYQKMASKGDNITNEDLVSIFCNISSDEVLRLPNGVYEEVLLTLSEVLSKTNDNHQLIQRFKLNQVEYGMIPNLEEITYGENKDMTTYLGDWSTMHLAMSVLFRPIDKKNNRKQYSIQQYNGTSEHRDVMEHMPLDIVLGAQLFFYRLTKALLNAIPNYLERVVAHNKQQTQVAITNEHGETMTSCLHSLRETLDGLTK
tara:strand:+ start:2504 stop:3154 length:651 start_codon:yes stop_codon:yes gene_type:complete